MGAVSNKNEIARELVGKDITPILFNAKDKITRGLSLDRFAFDDDGYYLVHAELRVPVEAIIMKYYSPVMKDALLQLDETLLTKRRLK